MTMAHELSTELETFRRLLPSLLPKEGKFALVVGDALKGVFDTYADALSEGYREMGLKPFLVKRIAGMEAIANFSRDPHLCTSTAQ